MRDEIKAWTSDNGPLFFCIMFITAVVFLNYALDFSFKNLILEQLYEVDIATIKRAADVACLAKPPVPAPITCPELPYLTLGSKISSNTEILKILNILFIFACLLALYQFCRIITSHRKSKGVVQTAAIALVVWYFLHCTGVIWDYTRTNSLEGHFARISVSMPLGAIETFCKTDITPAAATKAAALKTKNVGRFDGQLTDKNIYCPEGTAFVGVLFYLSLIAALLVLGFGMAAGAIGFNKLSSPSQKLLRDRLGPDGEIEKLTEILLEYRKRVDDIRTYLYYSSFVLVLGIGWMATHAKWSYPILISVWGNEALSMINGYITYVAIMYLLFVLGLFLPQTLYLQYSLRQFFYDNAGRLTIKIDSTFREWQENNNVDTSIASAKDLLAFGAPVASLVVSGLLEASSIKDIVGAIVLK